MLSPEERKKWRKANVEAGRETVAIGDRRRAEFARRLQEQKSEQAERVATIGNQGQTDVANIRQQGYDRRLTATQKFELPEQQALINKYAADTEGIEAGTKGELFAQKLTEQYAPREFAERFPPPKANATIPNYTGYNDNEEARLKEYGIQPTDEELLSAPGRKTPQSIQTPPPARPPGINSWDDFTRTPPGRMFDLRNVTDALKTTWKGLEYTGRGIEKGVDKTWNWLTNPIPKRRKEDKTVRFGTTGVRG